MRTHPGGWSNGKTTDSDSVYQGSNPCLPANNKIKRPGQFLTWSLFLLVCSFEKPNANKKNPVAIILSTALWSPEELEPRLGNVLY